MATLMERICRDDTRRLVGRRQRPAGEMMWLRPTLVMRTSRIDSGNAIPLGRRTARLRLLLNSLVRTEPMITPPEGDLFTRPWVRAAGAWASLIEAPDGSPAGMS